LFAEWAGSRDEVRGSCCLADDVAVLAGREMTLSFSLSDYWWLFLTKKLLTNRDNETSNEHYRAC
jgi:hypothetical protein